MNRHISFSLTEEARQFNMFSFTEDNADKNFGLNLEQLTYSNMLEGRRFSNQS